MSAPGRSTVRESVEPEQEGSPVIAWTSRIGVRLVRRMCGWPQHWRTALAWLLADVAWLLFRPRRRITLANLRACFPQMTEAERWSIGRASFRNLLRSVFDHAVLWHADQAVVERYVKVEGREHLLAAANRPLIVIAPHFVGLDAGGAGVSLLVRCVSVYARQKNPVWDESLLRGRQRFNDPVLLARQGVDMRSVIRHVRDGLVLYYLPDMDLGRLNSIFVPFFGVPAATIPMVPRIARMTGARVIMGVTEMTADGYTLHLEAPWEDFPGPSLEEDTARMNREIERWVLRLPAQYLWSHRRFKTRPEGEPGFY
jgi:Kdo2-lipid IVA lauroyltransferase/acyltransferase